MNLYFPLGEILIIKFFRIATILISNSFKRILWLIRDSKRANQTEFQAHLLVMNNIAYAKLARTCVESFLHFRPNSKITIHCDDKTKNEVRKAFRVLNFFRRGRIRLENLKSDLPWQNHKLDIILELSGTQSIFMDCDLRWNGSMPINEVNKIMYFVKEKPLRSYDKLIESAPAFLREFSESSMKNTSFFSWSGREILENQRAQIIKMWTEIYEHSQFQISESNGSLSRISEQVVLSVLPEIFSLSFTFLKESDFQFDGSLCESSYFGASGGRFALWGNTIRKSLF